MKRTAHLICWVLIALVAIAAFVYFGMSSLSKGLRSLHVGKEALGVLSPLVTVSRTGDEQEPLLEQYQKNPALVRQRYLKVVTWTHAARIFKILKNEPLYQGAVRSTSLADVSLDDSVDGWGNPYCVLVEPKRMIILSSGGNGVLSCDDLRSKAEEIALRATDSRLREEGDLLVAVYTRANVP